MRSRVRMACGPNISTGNQNLLVAAESFSVIHRLIKVSAETPGMAWGQLSVTTLAVRSSAGYSGSSRQRGGGWWCEICSTPSTTIPRSGGPSGSTAPGLPIDSTLYPPRPATSRRNSPEDAGGRADHAHVPAAPLRFSAPPRSAAKPVRAARTHQASRRRAPT